MIHEKKCKFFRKMTYQSFQHLECVKYDLLYHQLGKKLT